MACAIKRKCSQNLLATCWMAMYCLNMLAIAMELARENEAYEDAFRDDGPARRTEHHAHHRGG